MALNQNHLNDLRASCTGHIPITKGIGLVINKRDRSINAVISCVLHTTN
jgi:hypothetical protein